MSHPTDDITPRIMREASTPRSVADRDNDRGNDAWSLADQERADRAAGKKPSFELMEDCLITSKVHWPDYQPRDLLAKLGYFIEECGEAQAAAGKILRWGWQSYNPELPEEERETNRDWLLRELKDVRRALDLLEDAVRKET